MAVTVTTHTRTTRTGVSKALFWNFYKLAKREAYTKTNIKSAWRATGIHPFNPDKVLAEIEKKKSAKQLLVPRPASTPRSFKFLKTPQNRRELRQQTIAAISALESGEKESSIQLLRRMAHQTGAAWTRAELADIENEDFKTHYAGKKGPRGGRQKVTKAQVVDGKFVMKEEVAFQEKEQEAKKNAEAKAAKAKAKARNDAVAVGKRKGKAAAVAGVSSKKTKQEVKEVLMIFSAAFLHILTIYIDARCGRPESPGRRGRG